MSYALATLESAEREGWRSPPSSLDKYSEGEESAQGGWAQGPAPDGGGQIEYVSQAHGPVVDELAAVDPRVYGTPKQPVQPSST